MLVKFSDMNFENEANLVTAFQGVTACMQDTDLPVKVQACLSLQCMIRHETGISFLFKSELKCFYLLHYINILLIFLIIVRARVIPNLPTIMQGFINYILKYIKNIYIYCK